ncbi:hypothetical protein AB6A40_002944 [Gnathostoma spinigerum]|uniref:DNA polymerase epsilon subunit n=1 Tax=Gnathostoma spinigerum TaxID=75299 RepID=A0ABD6E825_9BILA
MSSKEKLRKHVRAVFQLRGYSLTRDALDYALSVFGEVTEQKRDLSIEKVHTALSKQPLPSGLIDLTTLQSAVAQCSNKKLHKSESLFTVIDLFSAPNFYYDGNSEKLVVSTKLAKSLGTGTDMINMQRARLMLVIQRARRSKAFEKFRLSTIEVLQGTAEKQNDVLLLGLLHQESVESYNVEDLTGSIPIDLTAATFHAGLFTDGSILLFEGNYNNGIFTASGVGLAPIEAAAATRAHFGDENFFGGDSPIAYPCSEKLQLANARNPDARIVILSDVLLDEPHVLKAISILLQGFSKYPPIAFIFCGNFTKKVNTDDSYALICAGFYHLSNILSSALDESPELSKAHFVFVPGPDDPSLNSILPRPPLPYSVFEIMNSIPNCSFASNPCRIQYTSQEIVIMRCDIIEKMCFNSIHMPSDTAEIAEHFCRTIASVGHLVPLPPHVSPVFWQMDYCLRLYPLPDLVVIADQFESFTVRQSDCLFTNPGSFARSQLDFQVYYPSSRSVEASCITL